MKSFIAALILFNLVFANAIADDVKKVVLHVSDPEKILQMIDTIKHLRRNHKNLEISVVVNGPAVVRLSKRYRYAKELVENTHWIGACAMGMFNNKMAQSDLEEGVHFLTESGIATLVKFQNDGYSYIKI